MTAGFDIELRRREHELNLKIDEMHAVLLSRNLKVRRENVWYPNLLQCVIYLCHHCI